MEGKSVLMRMLEVLTAVACCEHDRSRLATLRRHADLVLADAVRTVPNQTDLAEIRIRSRRFEAVRLHDGVAGML